MRRVCEILHKRPFPSPEVLTVAKTFSGWRCRYSLRVNFTNAGVISGAAVTQENPS
jgi:hypothetical protein